MITGFPDRAIKLLRVFLKVRSHAMTNLIVMESGITTLFHIQRSRSGFLAQARSRLGCGYWHELSGHVTRARSCIETGDLHHVFGPGSLVGFEIV